MLTARSLESAEYGSCYGWPMVDLSSDSTISHIRKIYFFALLLISISCFKLVSYKFIDMLKYIRLVNRRCQCGVYCSSLTIFRFHCELDMRAVTMWWEATGAAASGKEGSWRVNIPNYRQGRQSYRRLTGLGQQSQKNHAPTANTTGRLERQSRSVVPNAPLILECSEW